MVHFWKPEISGETALPDGSILIYILSGQKLNKNAKNGLFWRVFENLKLVVKQCYQTGQF